MIREGIKKILEIMYQLAFLSFCFYFLTKSDESVWAAIAFRFFLDLYFRGKLVQINDIQE